MGAKVETLDDDSSLDEIAEPFRPAFLTDRRYIWLTGGRGGAKSYNVAKGICMLSFVPDHRVLFTRYTWSSAKESIVKEIEEKIEILGEADSFDIKEKSITNTHSGSEIVLSGIQVGSKRQTAKLKGIKDITTWVGEEMEELQDEETFDTIDMSIRSKKRHNRIFVVMNPSDANHWTYKRWLEKSHRIVMIDGFPVQMSTHPEVLHIHVTYLNNLEHLAPSFIANAQRLKLENPDKYAHKMIGTWRPQAEGVVFTNWQEGEFDHTLPYCFGMDYGYFPDPQTLGKVAVDQKRKRIYVSEKLHATEMSDNDIIASIAYNVGNSDDLIVADTSEPRTSKKIKNAGYNIKSAKKGANSVMEGIRAMQDYTIIVTEDSHNVKRELNTYVWNDKRASIPVDDNNHHIDYIRYCLERLTRKSGGRKMTAL